MICEHDNGYYVAEDMYGKEYACCNECDEEVEVEDTRDFYIDEYTGKVTW